MVDNRATEIVTDPDNVPVRVINGVKQCGIVGSVIAMTLTTVRFGFDDGQLQPDVVVAARLRFDLEIARSLRDLLDSQIKLLTVVPEAKAN